MVQAAGKRILPQTCQGEAMPTLPQSSKAIHCAEQLGSCSPTDEAADTEVQSGREGQQR